VPARSASCRRAESGRHRPAVPVAVGGGFRWCIRFELVAGKSGRRSLAKQFHSFAKEFGALAKQFHSFAKEFRALTKQFHSFAKEFRALAKQFHSFAKEFGALAKQFRSFAKEFRALAKQFHSFAKEFRALAKQFHSFAKEFRALAKQFNSFAKEFGALAKEFRSFANEGGSDATPQHISRGKKGPNEDVTKCNTTLKTAFNYQTRLELCETVRMESAPNNQIDISQVVENTTATIATSFLPYVPAAS
jgi:DNA anti-recombination protein RmuC